MIEKYFVLSGGGCRGFAHLGVVKALKEHSIIPCEIAGTSAGAIAGTFLADGFAPDEIKELFLSQLKLSMFPLNWFKPGLISMKNIREFLEKNLTHTKFEQLQIPFYVTATNFINGVQTTFKEGELVNAVIAASSIPVLFPPVLINGIPYLDGGLSNNLPVEPFSDRKKDVVCVYVNPIKPFKSDEGSFEVLDRSIHLSFRPIVRKSSEGCYLYIEPENLYNYGLFDIHKLSEIFDVGYNSTKSILQNFKS